MTYLIFAIVGIVVAIAVVSIGLAWSSTPQVTTTRPTTSSRKSGRVSTGGGL